MIFKARTKDAKSELVLRKSLLTIILTKLQYKSVVMKRSARGVEPERLQHELEIFKKVTEIDGVVN